MTGQRILCLAGIPLLALGIYFSVRLAVADSYFREDTPESVAEAVRLDGGNAVYHDLLAEHLEGIGKDSVAERAAAARLSPRETRYWIALAVDAEVKRNYPQAEKDLLEAASVSRQFDPRWALMNFYFRRGRMPEFRTWTRRALDISYDDLAPIFRLCWLASGDAGAIESVLPPGNKKIESKYLGFLLSTQRLEAAPPIARELVERADAADVPLLLGYCDAMLAKNARAGLDVWNALCRRKLEPYDALVPATGSIITNGDFRLTPVEHGFDWRIPRVDGVFVTPRTGSDGLTFELSGEQPEDTVLLTEFVPVDGGREYRLNYEYRAPDEPEDSGLTWEAAAPDSDAVMARSAYLATTGDWNTGHLSFTPAANGAVRLSLRYRRALGTVRHKGTIVLRRVAAEVAR